VSLLSPFPNRQQQPLSLISCIEQATHGLKPTSSSFPPPIDGTNSNSKNTQQQPGAPYPELLARASQQVDAPLSCDSYKIEQRSSNSSQVAAILLLFQNRQATTSSSSRCMLSRSQAPNTPPPSCSPYHSLLQPEAPTSLLFSQQCKPANEQQRCVTVLVEIRSEHRRQHNSPLMVPLSSEGDAAEGPSGDECDALPVQLLLSS
jgi:hypothetical protein